MKKVSIFSVLFLVLYALFFILRCTINEDNGSIINPRPDNPIDTTGSQPTAIPAILANPDSLYITIGDTMSVHIQVFVDSTLSSTSPKPISGALVVATALRGRIFDDSLYTDANGRAVLLFKDTIESQVQLTLTCRGISVPVNFRVTNIPDQVQKLIEVLSEQSSIKADGVDSTIIKVKVIDENHNPVSNQYVQFISTAGVIAGVNPPEGNGNSGMGITDGGGIARAILTSTPINDTAFIRVFLVGNHSLNDETMVAFQGVTIQLTTDSTNLALGAQTLLTATLRNGSDQPIANSRIYFVRSRGSLSNITMSGIDTATGFDGKARALISAGSTGNDNILVYAAGASASIKFNVTNLLLTMEASSKELQAKKDTARVYVTFSDQSGTPLVSKALQLVRFYKTIDGAPISDTLSGITNVTGKDTFTLDPVDYDCAVRVQVTAFNTSSEIASTQTTLNYRSTRTLTINAIPPLIPADGTSKSQITVNVKTQKEHNPIVGDRVFFSTDAGTISTMAVTDSVGRAIVNLTSDRRNAIAKVKAWLEKEPTRVDSIIVEFTGVELSAAAAPLSIGANGIDSSLITVTLKDASRNPISGELIEFTTQQKATTILKKDSLTNNRGEGSVYVKGTGQFQDTISVRCAGASTFVVINYSSNILSIDTVRGINQHYIANPRDSTRIKVTYLHGNGITPIPNTRLEVSATMGNLGTVFADTITTDAAGSAIFTMKNPDFANTATITALVHTTTEITSTSFQLYFRAAPIHRIFLTGSPEVISTNGARSTITATCVDSNGNRVKDAHIAFNMISGPGGGERINPATAITRADGTATTTLISGTLPSNYKDVHIVAGDFTAIKSDTVKFTIAGPPAHITIRTNLGDIIDNPNGTYSYSYSAIVTDINGNPVADGTEVTFSAQITGTVIYKLSSRFTWNSSAYYWYNYIDTTYEVLPFEDLNNSYTLDMGEDKNRDGLPNRGEDLNGDGIFNVGPAFEDINWNGRRDMIPEPIHPDTSRNESMFADFNNNNLLDLWEPLTEPDYYSAYIKYIQGLATAADSAYIRNSDNVYWSAAILANNGNGYDIDWDANGISDPSTAISTTRTIQTVNGVASNSLIYGQNDGWRIQATLSAESQGLVTISPETFILPISKEDKPYWSYRKSH